MCWGFSLNNNAFCESFSNNVLKTFSQSNTFSIVEDVAKLAFFPILCLGWAVDLDIQGSIPT